VTEREDEAKGAVAEKEDTPQDNRGFHHYFYLIGVEILKPFWKEVALHLY
jgi:hypothetical protein